MTTALVSPALASHSISSTTGPIQACGGGGASPNSSVKVTHISRQCFAFTWPDGGLWTGTMLASHEGNCPLPPSPAGLLLHGLALPPGLLPEG